MFGLRYTLDVTPSELLVRPHSVTSLTQSRGWFLLQLRKTPLVFGVRLVGAVDAVGYGLHDGEGGGRR